METTEFAEQFATTLQKGDIVALYGDLGAGKTTFVQTVAALLSPDELVQSPTFTYLNIYEGNPPLFHFDLYRLKSAQEFLDHGFLDYLELEEGICFIEWPDCIDSLLPKKVKKITIKHTACGGRNIHVDPS